MVFRSSCRVLRVLAGLPMALLSVAQVAALLPAAGALEELEGGLLGAVLRGEIGALRGGRAVLAAGGERAHAADALLPLGVPGAGLVHQGLEVPHGVLDDLVDRLVSVRSPGVDDVALELGERLEHVGVLPLAGFDDALGPRDLGGARHLCAVLLVALLEESLHLLRGDVLRGFLLRDLRARVQRLEEPLRDPLLDGLRVELLDALEDGLHLPPHALLRLSLRAPHHLADARVGDPVLSGLAPLRLAAIGLPPGVRLGCLADLWVQRVHRLPPGPLTSVTWTTRCGSSLRANTMLALPCKGWV